jgi:hypothetical protein
MKNFLKIFLSLVILLSPLSAFAIHHGEEGEAKQSKMQVDFSLGNDFFAAGENVDLFQDVEDDAFVAAAMVNAFGKIGGDLNVAGSSLTITGDVGDDLRVAGANIVITGNTVGSAMIAGANVNIGDEAAFGDDSIVMGGMVNFSGEVVGNLEIKGGVVRYSGFTDGDLIIRVDDELLISENSKVSGKLTYSAKNEIEIPSGIAAEVVYLPRGKDMIASEVSESVSRMGDFNLFSNLFSLVIAFLAGMLLIGLFPNAAVAAADVARKKIWQSALVGSLLFLLPFFIGLILLISGVGVLVGGLVFAYWMLLLLFASAISGYVVGSFIFKQNSKTSFRKKLLTLFIGLILIAAVSFIPSLGGMLSFLIFIYSLGVVMLTEFNLYKSAKKAKLL